MRTFPGGGGGGCRVSDLGALSPAPHPPTCKPAGAQGWTRGCSRGPNQVPETPSKWDPQPGPARGAEGLGSNPPIFLFDNIPRRPLFVFIVSERERISELKLKKPICFQ